MRDVRCEHGRKRGDAHRLVHAAVKAVADFRDPSGTLISEVFFGHRSSLQASSAIAFDEAPLIHEGVVARNEPLCRDHFRILVRVPRFRPAKPGQFLHVSPTNSVRTHVELRGEDRRASESWSSWMQAPLLRRAYSIAGLSWRPDGVELQIIYRVVGKTTHWLQKLRPDEFISVLGPLGNQFPIDVRKSQAWLVAGGVGLPPMLWLAQELHSCQRRAIAFCGVQRAELLPLTLDSWDSPASDAGRATFSAMEFRQYGVPMVISTDDGSLGFRGHVGEALAAYHAQNPVSADDLVVYTCGPERMMRFVAEYCVARGIWCFACMERNMACGLGTCQSCAVAMVDGQDPQGWRYRLCCTDGPVFDAKEILWSAPHLHEFWETVGNPVAAPHGTSRELQSLPLGTGA